MGYDMRIRGTLPEPDPATVTRLRAELDQLNAEWLTRTKLARENDPTTFQADPPEGWLEADIAYQQAAHPASFHLNISGMNRYCVAMLDLNMMHISACPVSHDDWATLPDYDDNETAYDEACDRLTGQHGASTHPGIPDWKFSTNDGWYVTPEEIRAALHAWDTHPAYEPLPQDTITLTRGPLWEAWITYLRLAAHNGGFRVY